jgi:hypothetical protein
MHHCVHSGAAAGKRGSLQSVQEEIRSPVDGIRAAIVAQHQWKAHEKERSHQRSN